MRGQTQNSQPVRPSTLTKMVSLSLKLLMPRARKPKEFVKEPDALSIQNPLKNPEMEPSYRNPFLEP